MSLLRMRLSIVSDEFKRFLESPDVDLNCLCLIAADAIEVRKVHKQQTHWFHFPLYDSRAFG